MALRPGDPLPDLALRDADGADVRLGGLGGEHTLLIFLRHLA
jgi:peroxiredoxin